MMLNLPDLAYRTLTAPREAAQDILALNFRRNDLWLGMLLAAAINAILFSLSINTTQSLGELPQVFTNPILFCAMMFALMAMTSVAFQKVGASFGGQGTLDQILALLVWLQLLRAAAQLVLIVLSAVSPGMAVLFSLVIGFWGLWILVNFVTVVHGFDSVLNGVLTIILGGAALMVFLVVVLAIAQMLGIIVVEPLNV